MRGHLFSFLYYIMRRISGVWYTCTVPFGETALLGTQAWSSMGTRRCREQKELALRVRTLTKRDSSIYRGPASQGRRVHLTPRRFADPFERGTLAHSCPRLGRGLNSAVCVCVCVCACAYLDRSIACARRRTDPRTERVAQRFFPGGGRREDVRPKRAACSVLRG